MSLIQRFLLSSLTVFAALVAGLWRPAWASAPAPHPESEIELVRLR